MVIALVLIIGIVCASWAWRLQHRALRLLRERPSHLARVGGGREGTPARGLGAVVVSGGEDPIGGSAGLAGAPAMEGEAEAAPGRVALAPASVLGWDAFAIVSTLVLDGRVLVGCTRRPDLDYADGDERGARPGPAETATFVLLLGEDGRAVQAHALLEAWRQGEDTLRLRPAPVTGAIEVYDARRRALRARLLAS